MTAENMQSATGRDFPQAHGAIMAGRENARAIRREGHSRHRPSVSDQMLDFLAVVQVPDADDTVYGRGGVMLGVVAPRASHHALAIARDGQAANFRRVPAEAFDFLSCDRS